MNAVPKAIEAYCRYLDAEVPADDDAGWSFPFADNFLVRLSNPDTNTLLVSAPVNGRKIGEEEKAGFERLLKVSTAIMNQVNTTITYDADASQCLLFNRIELENKSSADINDEIDTVVDDFEYVLDMLERM